MREIETLSAELELEKLKVFQMLEEAQLVKDGLAVELRGLEEASDRVKSF
jgi:hypothetical protein